MAKEYSIKSPQLNTLLRDETLSVVKLIWYHFVRTSYLYDERRDTKVNETDVDTQ